MAHDYEHCSILDHSGAMTSCGLAASMEGRGFLRVDDAPAVVYLLFARRRYASEIPSSSSASAAKTRPSTRRHQGRDDGGELLPRGGNELDRRASPQPLHPRADAGQLDPDAAKPIHSAGRSPDRAGQLAVRHVAALFDRRHRPGPGRQLPSRPRNRGHHGRRVPGRTHADLPSQTAYQFFTDQSKPSGRTVGGCAGRHCATPRTGPESPRSKIGDCRDRRPDQRGGSSNPQKLASSRRLQKAQAGRLGAVICLLPESLLKQMVGGIPNDGLAAMPRPAVSAPGPRKRRSARSTRLGTPSRRPCTNRLMKFAQTLNHEEPESRRPGSRRSPPRTPPTRRRWLPRNKTCKPNSAC